VLARTRMPARTGHLVLTLLALLLALTLVATASAAGSRYKGKTKQGTQLSFRTTASSVVGFKTSVSVPCSSAVTGNRVTDVRPVSIPKAPLKSGHFKGTFKIPSIALVIVAKGIVTGGSARGSLDVRYTKIIGTTSAGLQDIAGCYAKTTWTAKKV
jgi:hypothetical protein